ncbi:PREDICTED: uncharacterized protein LOC105961191 [Erythranthe guttata]|uniref:uncharacterized protein LOC105961191 n=1 Tax=Erythranthe guttata TaxID=4155 RepID=UPI00064DE649|nr:PREDICTED: uncharacterized protein LOC105961191 [Erythranthe guttata]|eukprot:XP_012840888.1 PREDICTED: uncharacterized protein LOC105961191 [Erythranthe guttata]
MDLEFLKKNHRRRVKVLADSGPDLIAFETIPNKLEAQSRRRVAGVRASTEDVNLVVDAQQLKNTSLINRRLLLFVKKKLKNKILYFKDITVSLQINPHKIGKSRKENVILFIKRLLVSSQYNQPKSILDVVNQSFNLSTTYPIHSYLSNPPTKRALRDNLTINWYNSD